MNSAETHPKTGTDYRTPLYVSRSGRKFYPIGGAADPAEVAAAEKAAAEKAAAEKSAAEKAAAEKAAADAAASYKAPATQEELDKLLGDRLARERSKFSDYDELKAKAAELAELQKATASDQEKVVIAAREEEKAKERAAAVPRLVKAEFKAAAKGVLTEEQLSALLEDLDLSKYVDDKGEIDEEKVTKKVTAFAPANGSGGKTRDLGQGPRTPANTTAGADGLAQAQKRFPKKYESTKS